MAWAPPPPPPPMPQPVGGIEWAHWQLKHTFNADDGVIIEWLVTVPQYVVRQSEYVKACHVRQWKGWQASLVWQVVEALTDRWGGDDDIPF